MPERLRAEEAERFLFAEARLLDERRFEEWEALFADDAVYWLPIDPDKDPSQAVAIIYDDRQRLHERVYRLTKTPVLDQNPPSRTIRFVSNVEVADGERADEAVVHCRQLIAEMRPGGPGQEGLNAPRLFAARCQYRLRQVGGAWKIALKQVVLLTSDEPQYNLSFIP
ncbi:MAG: aromatic-ring-hydroxylating dioxygenase subunit beta [Armatimonadota bacterium]|nr:aromatic-ring-hydroxylating dioxygenase subunit beta [Armatimonadota bacterium]MDR7520680.1 aromatic-ring-hydroxylating dioxygenase subunit beta [Armatimonadota bacterium]MDR7549985.1 aromatic-ring-hydroxylating dioxygenase subunit beta [Armatimonadota bacterium]